ncbi:MAG: alpha/beta fold hydrolase [Candidatus Zixiibacteriota bacterium]|nr:MAG: alpha/beta fold hydrolase [candidate division Zixibacteria bacterium]
MRASAVLLCIYLILCCPSILHCQQIDKSSENRLKELVVPSSCLESFSRTVKSYDVEKVIIPSDDIELAGELYLPKSTGPYPAVIYMHGGGNDYDMLMSSPRYYAPRMAHCGFAFLAYEKRGTGESGGVFHEATYDDFIADAGHAADFLAQHDRIDPDKIGIYGGSQGGRLAPVVATRFPSVSFVISASGPIGTLADHATFNIEYALKVRGYEDSTIEQVMPLWRRHHTAWESLDPDDLNNVAEDIFKFREFIDPMALPNTRQEFLTDSNLFFLRPPYFSMSKDYTGELVNLDVPWLAIYGELDPIINVRESVENIRKQMTAGDNTQYEIIVIKSVGHSFNNSATREQVPVINVAINWINEMISH